MNTAIETDIVLIGTGLAPLLVAKKISEEGLRVIILNPDDDFFLENQELGFDPFLFSSPNFAQTIIEHDPENILQVVRPNFPGAVEYWSDQTQFAGFFDPTAPHVRLRNLIFSNNSELLPLQFSEKNVHFQVMQGASAVARFPGINFEKYNFTTPDPQEYFLLSRFSDVDAHRYRYGILEFLQDKLGDECILLSAKNIEIIPDGLRFQSNQKTYTVETQLGSYFFWTPKSNSIIQNIQKMISQKNFSTPSIQQIEKYFILSKENLDHTTIVNDKNLWCLSSITGQPDQSKKENVLEILVTQENATFNEKPLQSLNEVDAFIRGKLGWSKFKIRNYTRHYFYNWDSFTRTGNSSPDICFPLLQHAGGVYAVLNSSGSIYQISNMASTVSKLILANQQIF